MKGVDYVPSGGLVDELECDFVSEWPLQDVVKLSLHQDKKQRHVAPLADAISQDVEPQAHLVAIATSVEWQAEDGCILATLSVVHSLTELGDFPDHRAIMIAVFNEGEPEITILEICCF